MTAQAAAAWGGRASGEVLADLLRQRAEQHRVPVSVEVTAWRDPDGYGVTVEWGRAPGQQAMFEVADWSEDVRLLDQREDVAIESALEYLDSRLRQVGPQRPGG